MPVYTYRCSNCGIQFEKQQSFSDQSLIRCPECGKRALKKVYMPVGIVFKGAGFYATDHHSPSGQTNKFAEKENSEGKEPVVKNESGADKKEADKNKQSAEKSDKRSEKKE